MKSPQKTNSNLFSRWLGLSSTSSTSVAPLQLVALEDRVLYSAGPVPVEVVTAGADLVSQGDQQDVTASDLGLASLEVDITNTLDFLEVQVESEVSADSIANLEPLDGIAVGLDGVSDLEAGSELLVSAASSPATALASQTVIDSVSSSSDDRVTAEVSAGVTPGVSISGRIFHDVDGDGSVDEDMSLQNVEVRLYRDVRNGVLDFGDAVTFGNLVATTDANGYYEFTNLLPGQTYYVVVNSLSLGNHFEFNGLLNSGFNAEDVWGVQTYTSEGGTFDRGSGLEIHAGGAFYGGLDVNQSDSSSVVSDFQHIIQHSSVSADVTDVDFGFSFNVVTNTRDVVVDSVTGQSNGDDPAVNRTIQGSLRQFITNANAIVGDNELRFVPVVDASETLSSGGIWRIDVETILPTITDAGTSISGIAYQTDGTLFAANPVQVSAGGASVAAGVDDDLLGPSVSPQLELSGALNPNSGIRPTVGLLANADRFEVSNLALVNFRVGITVTGEDVIGTAITDNFIGVRPDGSQAALPQVIGVAVADADQGTIEGNFIVNSVVAGISIDGNLGESGQAEDWVIQNNYIVNRDGFIGSNFGDGIALLGGTDGAIVSNNRIENSREFGIDLWNNRGSVVIQNNTITGAGRVRFDDGVEVGGGIGLASAGNVIQDNEIRDNVGAGILVRGTAQFDTTDIVSATGNLISQNYFEANSGLDIDITRPQDLPLRSGALEIAAGDGLNALDGTLDADTGSNGIDRPELSMIGLQSNVLTIEGSFLNLISDPKIELYLIGPNDSKTYFATVSVADQTSYDSSTGEFTAELTEPDNGWPSGLISGADVAAIIIDGSTSDTSEFSLATEVTLTNEAADFDTDRSEFNPDENTTRAADLMASDPEGGAVTYSIVGGEDAGLFIIEQSTGVLNFVTAPDFESPNDNDGDGVYSVVVNVQDDQGLGTDRELTITVDDVNEPRTFDTVGSDFSLDENTTFVVDLDSTDPERGGIRYSIVGGDDAALFTVGSRDGRLNFVNPPDFENPIDSDGDGVYSVNVRVEDDDGLGEDRELLITVNNVDEAPTFDTVGTDFSLDENTTFVVDLDSSGPDGGTVSYSVVGGADAGAFLVDERSGILTLVTSADFENPTDSDGDGVYSVIVNVQDDEGLGENRELTVTVNDVNEPRTFDNVGSDFSLDENTTFVVDLDSSDPDRNGINYSIVGGDDAAFFTVGLRSGRLNFVNAPDFENPIDSDGDGVYSVIVNIQDDEGLGEDRELLITVNNVDEAPTFDTVGTDFSLDENTTFVVDLDSSGPDGGTVNYSVVGGADAGAFLVDERSGILTLVTPADFENPTDSDGDGVYSVIVNVQDDEGLGEDRELTVTVNDVNEPRTFDTVGSDFSLDENTTFVVDLASTDPERNGIRYSIVGGDDAALFTVGLRDGRLDFVNAPDFENPTDSDGDGVYSVIVNVQDDEGLGEDRELTITVNDVVETVIAVADTASVDEGAAVQVDVVANDIVDVFDRLSSREVVSVSNGTASFNSDGLLEFVHDGSETTLAEVVYQIVNEEGNFDTATVDFVINPIDDLGNALDDELTVDSADVTRVSVSSLVENDEDIDSNVDNFEFEIVDQPELGTVAVVDGFVEYTPSDAFEGVETFTYQLVSADGVVRSDVAEVSITVESPMMDFPPPDSEQNPDDSQDETVVTPADVGDPTGMNPLVNGNDDDIGRVQAIPEPIELDTTQLSTNNTSVSQNNDTGLGLQLDYEGNVYSYFGRTQFLDLASSELSVSLDDGTFQDRVDSTHQLSLSQFLGESLAHNPTSQIDFANLNVGDLVFSPSGISFLTLIGVFAAGALTTSQIPRVLDVGLLLDDEESIEDIVSS